MEGVHWRRGEKIGAGGFATVFKAKAATARVNKSYLPSLMAVKTMEASKSSSLIQEAETLSSFQHQPTCPFIIGYYGHDVSIEVSHGKEQQLFNVFLEYASHGSLKNKIRRSSTGLPESLVRSYTRSIAKGLKHIHSHGYVHCDIKPDNILLAADSSTGDSDLIVPKIADFGLAKPVGDKVHGLRGTPQYMAPESINSNEFEPHCDVWALGCVVLEMLTGKRAWCLDVGAPLSSLLDRIAKSEELPAIPTRLSPEATEFIRNCLVKDPTLRWNVDVLLKHPFLFGRESGCRKVGFDLVLEAPMHPFDIPSVETDDGLSSGLSQFLENRLKSVHVRDRQIGDISASSTITSEFQ